MPRNARNRRIPVRSPRDESAESGPLAEVERVPRRRPHPALLGFFAVLAVTLMLAGALLPGERKARRARGEAGRIDAARQMVAEELWLAATDAYEKIAGDPTISASGRSNAAEAAGDLRRERLADPIGARRCYEVAFHHETATGRREELRRKIDAAPLVATASATLAGAASATGSSLAPSPAPASGSAASPVPADETAIAKVGDAEVTIEDILYAWKRVNRDEEPDEAALHDFTIDYLNLVLLAEGARREGLGDRFGVRLERRLQERQTLSGAMLATVKDAVTEEEARARHEADPSAWSEPAALLLEHLIVADEAAAAEVSRRLESGEAFETVASEASLDRGRLPRGCEIGWVELGAAFLPSVGSAPGLVDTLAKLEDGATTGPIATARGLDFFRVASRREAAPLPFERVKERVVRDMRVERRKSGREELLKGLREKIESRVYEDRLRAALASLDEARAAQAAAAAGPPAEDAATTATLPEAAREPLVAPGTEPSPAPAAGPDGGA